MLSEKLLAMDWQAILKDEFSRPYMDDLAMFIENERISGVPVYPPEDSVFNAFNLTPYNTVRVVIVGQDPYHGPGQAHGLCFSVPQGITPPPSLLNIFKEMRSDLGVPVSAHGCLESWARQGVLLLNAALTVRDGQPQSHYKRGWEKFTDVVISKLSERKSPIVFVLWGRFACKKCQHINPQHYTMKAPHPSPFSAFGGFFGCRHFSKVNKILSDIGEEPVDWRL